MPKYDIITICNTEPLTDPERKIVFCDTEPSDPNRNIVFCPNKDPDNHCEVTEQLTITGPSVLAVSSVFTIKGGKPPHIWYIPSDITDYTQVSDTLTINAFDEPCSTKTEGIAVKDSCGNVAAAAFTIQRTTAALSLSGDADVSVGEIYTASGGFPPYTYSFDDGTIDSSGEILTVNSCFDSAMSFVRVSDTCGYEATVEVRLPDGHWQQISTSQASWLSCNLGSSYLVPSLCTSNGCTGWPNCSIHTFTRTTVGTSRYRYREEWWLLDEDYRYIYGCYGTDAITYTEINTNCARGTAHVRQSWVDEWQC